ncbi:MAG: hypothetical protein EOO14_17225 [Chitinophagaceae bacterium]|nr:MAG: hypothetical protein EOO14_17225 [Chitinophagaceae bacterium]
MKRISYALWAFCLFSFLIACKKESTEPDVVFSGGVATAVGTPDGSASVKKNIGAAGGTLTSRDGRLKLTIPAGALATAQEVSIQAISNHNPLAVEKAYRIEPHGVEFAKPVSLVFSYADDDVANTLPEALGIAYQDGQGIWQAQRSATVDKGTKTVTVTTTHFSDWTLFEKFYLLTSAKSLAVSGSADLEVVTTDDLLAPLTQGQQKPMGKKITLPGKYIQEWKLTGAGKLQPSGATAVYKAPATVPAAPNPVAISVKLNLPQEGIHLLLSHIAIQNDGEIEVRIAGGAWFKHLASPAVKLANGYYAMADSDGDEYGKYVLIQWMGGVGTHGFKQPTSPTGTHVHYLITGGNNYTCAYINASDEFVASGGGVTITSMGEEDGFIKGTFIANPAGFGDMLRSTTTLEGKFRVRKSW